MNDLAKQSDRETLDDFMNRNTERSENLGEGGAAFPRQLKVLGADSWAMKRDKEYEFIPGASAGDVVVQRYSPNPLEFDFDERIENIPVIEGHTSRGISEVKWHDIRGEQLKAAQKNGVSLSRNMLGDEPVDHILFYNDWGTLFTGTIILADIHKALSVDKNAGSSSFSREDIREARIPRSFLESELRNQLVRTDKQRKNWWDIPSKAKNFDPENTAAEEIDRAFVYISVHQLGGQIVTLTLRRTHNYFVFDKFGMSKLLKPTLDGVELPCYAGKVDFSVAKGPPTKNNPDTPRFFLQGEQSGVIENEDLKNIYKAKAEEIFEETLEQENAFKEKYGGLLASVEALKQLPDLLHEKEEEKEEAKKAELV